VLRCLGVHQFVSGAETARRIDRAGRCISFGLTVAALGVSDPVRSQVSGSITLASDDRYRGRSLSAGQPAATATLGYDSPAGIYIDTSATVALKRDDGLVLTGGAVDVGYAWRSAHGIVIDVGATRRQFTSYLNGNRPVGFSEVYVGIIGRSLSARLSYSPDYFSPGSHALYLGADAVVRPAASWRITAHAGAIAYLSPIRVVGLQTIEYDYGIGIEHPFHAFVARLNLSSGGPDADYYRGTAHRKTAITVGVTYAF
jgi:uncharacterized protein (TIGR02001 family)